MGACCRYWRVFVAEMIEVSLYGRSAVKDFVGDEALSATDDRRVSHDMGFQLSVPHSHAAHDGRETSHTHTQLTP